MTARCEPPEALRQVDGWHWLTDPNGQPYADQWTAKVGKSPTDLGSWDGYSPEQQWADGYRYVCPIPSPAELAALRGENEQMRCMLKRAMQWGVSGNPHYHAGRAAELGAEITAFLARAALDSAL